MIRENDPFKELNYTKTCRMERSEKEKKEVARSLRKKIYNVTL